jgi:hypothetical protein
MCELIVLGLIIVLVILIVCSHRFGYITGEKESTEKMAAGYGRFIEHYMSRGEPTHDYGYEGLSNNASAQAQAHASAQAQVNASGRSATLTSGNAGASAAPTGAATPAPAVPVALPAPVIAPVVPNPVAAPAPALSPEGVHGAAKAKNADCCKYLYRPDYWYLTDGYQMNPAYANWYALQ